MWDMGYPTEVCAFNEDMKGRWFKCKEIGHTPQECKRKVEYEKKIRIWGSWGNKQQNIGNNWFRMFYFCGGKQVTIRHFSGAP